MCIRDRSFPALDILRDATNIPPPVPSTTEQQKVIPIILNGKDSADRMKEITDRLETGIQELFDSDRYKGYLTTMAKFHNYSFNNTLLILFIAKCLTKNKKESQTKV